MRADKMKVNEQNEKKQKESKMASAEAERREMSDDKPVQWYTFPLTNSFSGDFHWFPDFSENKCRKLSVTFKV